MVAYWVLAAATDRLRPVTLGTCRATLEPPRWIQLAVLPHHKHWAGDEDGAIRSGNDADEQSQHEAMDSNAAKEQQRYQGQHHGEAGGNGAPQRLVEAHVYHIRQIPAGE